MWEREIQLELPLPFSLEAQMDQVYLEERASGRSPEATLPAERELPALTPGKLWKPKPLEQVVILGMGLTAKDYTQFAYKYSPWDEEGTEVWTLNAGAWTFHHDLAWNMHDLEELDRIEKRQFVKRYQKLRTPLVTVRHIPELPNSLEFPIAQVIEQFDDSYFANGVSYMIVGALLCGVKRIQLWGCDYSYPGKDAYEAGRANVEYWLGVAKHKFRVEIGIPNSSQLMDMCYRGAQGRGAIGYGKVYGYFDRQPLFGLDGDGLKVSGFAPTFEEVEREIEGG